MMDGKCITTTKNEREKIIENHLVVFACMLVFLKEIKTNVSVFCLYDY